MPKKMRECEDDSAPKTTEMMPSATLYNRLAILIAMALFCRKGRETMVV
jgi:hypothetical protein